MAIHFHTVYGSKTDCVVFQLSKRKFTHFIDYKSQAVPAGKRLNSGSHHIDYER